MRTLILLSLLLLGCSQHKDVVIAKPVQVPVLVPVQDCASLERLNAALETCLPVSREITKDVKGLCQLAVDKQMLETCVKEQILINQQAINECKNSSEVK